MDLDLNQPQARLDRAEFARLCDDCRAVLVVVAGAEVGPADAEDVVQKAMMVGMERLDQFEPGTHFKAWMAAIVGGVALNHRRGRRREEVRVRAFQQMKAQTSQEASGGFEKHGEESSGVDPEVLAALDELSQAERICFHLKAVLDHTYAEIAEVVGVPEATARTHVFRARKRLVQLLLTQEGGSRA